ncbi:MAG: pantoate--beta-alanine ligase [Planctomycetes bacterium]|nr:pantoate--beta-alanine ligase [Planctomycetota bacterium]
MVVVATTIEETGTAISDARRRGLSLGLVPTMGALHAGHASLMSRARRETGFVVVSIFVNPTQFGPHEDLSRYPRPFEKDVALCDAESADLVFHPRPELMYPPAFKTYVEVHELQDMLEGASRPGHFRGVATVVLKLFSIIQPEFAYFGQKDAQQVRVIQQMVRDLNVPVKLVVCPTIREADGLALSSRNQYLSVEERKNAVVIFNALSDIRKRVEAGERNVPALIRAAQERIDKVADARLDYLAIVDHDTLQPLQTLTGRALVAIAVFLGRTRLIDNILLEIPS